MNLRTVRRAFAIAALIGGVCHAQISVSTIPYPDVPVLKPTDAAKVQILRAEPARPHQKLGEITVNAAADPTATAQQVEERLRAAAGKLGADAAVIVVDPRQPSAVGSRSWWGTPKSRMTAGDVIAVAIRYQ